HAAPRVHVGIGFPGLSFAIGSPYYVAPAPVVYERPVVEEEAYAPETVLYSDPLWVWVPDVGYRYWNGFERSRWEHEHGFARLERRGYEHNFRDHDRWYREHGNFDRYPHGHDYRGGDHRGYEHNERTEHNEHGYRPGGGAEIHRPGPAQGQAHNQSHAPQAHAPQGHAQSRGGAPSSHSLHR
ncbi:MAG TPA: hypothetical protein VGM29_04285, partial [Polyangiaceae bacterium]